MFLYNYVFQDKTDERAKEGEDKDEDKSPASETTEEKAPGKDAKTKVKEDFDNIHIPKMPKKEKDRCVVKLLLMVKEMPLHKVCTVVNSGFLKTFSIKVAWGPQFLASGVFEGKETFKKGTVHQLN